MIPIVELKPAPASNGPDCSDRDEDCESIADKGALRNNVWKGA